MDIVAVDKSQDGKTMRGVGNPSDDIVEEMVGVLVGLIAPRRIILFGSRARGTAGAESDVDLMVVVDEGFGPMRSRRLELTRMWRALSRFMVPKDLLLFSSDEVEHWRGSLNHVVARALREGRTVYERP